MSPIWFWWACTTQSERLPENSQPVQTQNEDDDSAIWDDSGDPEETVRFCASGTVPVPENEAQFCIMTCEAAFFEEQALSGLQATMRPSR